MVDLREYEIENVSRVEQITNDVFFVYADERFVYKRAIRRDYVEIQQRAELVAAGGGFESNRIIQSQSGKPVDKNGFYLMTLVEGTAQTSLPPLQLLASIKFLGDYLSVLSRVPARAEDFYEENIWDLAYRPEFIRKTALTEISGMGLEYGIVLPIQEAVRRLEGIRHVFDTQEIQLIHNDLGPGNIIFSEDRPVGIIDFTPGLDSAIFALCQFLYWNVFYFSGSIDKEFCEEVLHRVVQDLECTKAELEAHLLRVALYRVIAPLFEHRVVTDSILKRLNILQLILKRTAT